MSEQQEKTWSPLIIKIFSLSLFFPLSLLSQVYIKIRQFCIEWDQGLSIGSKIPEMRRFGVAVTGGIVFLAGCLSDSWLPSP